MSKGDKYENLSPKEDLDMIRPYLRNLINDHKTPMELTNKVNINDTKFGEWKIQLVILNNCVSSKDFEETRSIYSASNPIKLFMGSDTKDIIDKLLIQFYKNFKKQEKHQMIEEVNLFMKMLVYYIIIFIKWT